MDDSGRLWLGTMLPLLFIIISVLVNVCKSSVLEVSEGYLNKLDEENDRRVDEIWRLRGKKLSFSTWVSIDTLVLVSAATMLMTFYYDGPLAGFFSNLFNVQPNGFINALGSTVTFLICITICVVFGYALPRRIAAANPTKYLFSTLYGFSFLKPVIRLLSFVPSKLVRIILRLIGVDPDKNLSEITEDEIRHMVDVGNESGTIEFSEREMINNVFDFDDLDVGDIMTHRTELAAVEKTDGIKSVIDLATKEGFSRIPVYNEDIDNIVGIINVKDLLKYIGKDKYSEIKINDLMRSVIYVPETAKCSQILKKFQAEKSHFAVVVDEYGGTAGVVTMEDLLESIVGNIQDEYDSEDEEITKIGDDEYLIYGGVSIEDVEELFDITLDNSEESDTLSGLMLNTLGIIPSAGDHPYIELNGIRFTAQEIGDRRIAKVHAKRLEIQAEAE